MPTYSYRCNKCDNSFELFFYIKNYIEQPQCNLCGSDKTERCFTKDAMTLNTSIKKSDNELKTIGDLARRNAEKMSEDEKISLYQKHNSYKEQESIKKLPSGMQRVKKPMKTKWPGSTIKPKRKPKNG
jgi:putative FmdB family regulatory protein